MNQITNFAQLRADGRVIPAAMTTSEMLALGWKPSKVIALSWVYCNRQIKVEEHDGIHGILVPGGNYIAALLNTKKSDRKEDVVVFSPSGSIHGIIGSPIYFSNSDFYGAFSWFEPAMEARVDTFGAVFQTDRQTTFRCDIDARVPVVTKALQIN